MPPSKTSSRKRFVNLTLSESLVAQAKTYTGNLSATMESLLAQYVAGQQQAQLSRRQLAHACAAGSPKLATMAILYKLASFSEDSS